MNHENVRDMLLGLTGAFLVALLALAGQALHAATADATPPRLSPPVVATWYGPGFYGNGTACGQRYTTSTRGVAVPSLHAQPCGTRLTICRYRRCVRVRVIDTGGFHHAFDLSARTAMDLCRCTRPYTMTVRYHHGWIRA